MNQSPTQKWLRENTSFYSNSSRVYTDIDAVLSRYPTLRPKTDVYTYDDGRTQLLLCLHGLLSILYRQSSYNIPIAIWLTRDYPKEPPIVYVVATSDMLVRSSKFIEVSGRCNIEYLQNWLRKSEACNVLALLESMQSHFSKEPPVYAKVKEPPQPQRASTQNNYLSKPPPPLPRNQSHSPRSSQDHSSMPITSQPYSPSPPLQSGPMSTYGTDRPPLPPKPSASVSNLYAPSSIYPTNHPYSPPKSPPSISNSLTTSPSSTTRNIQQPFTPPPIPPPLPVDYNHLPRTSGVHVATPVNNAPDVQQRSQHWPHPQTTSNVPVVSQMYPVASISPPQDAYLPPQPPPVQVPPPPLLRHSRPPPRNFLDEDVTEEQSQDRLPLPAPAPPRPPNPELLHLHSQVHAKLTSEQASLRQAMTLDAERLRTQQSDLLTGEPAIRDEMARLQAVQDVCRSVADRLRGVVDHGERNVMELKQKGDPEVDELVCSTTIVHNQLINLVAEDNAIEDTIYHLHRALNSGRIDMERFLRTTRALAEEQFMKRALIEKIQLRIPMGSWA